MRPCPFDGQPLNPVIDNQFIDWQCLTCHNGFTNEVLDDAAFAPRTPPVSSPTQDEQAAEGRSDVGTEFVQQVEAFERGDMDKPLAEWEEQLLEADRRRLTCKRCGGGGSDPKGTLAACQRCGGAGYYLDRETHPNPLAGGREVLLQLADDLRADVARAMSADQARAAWFRERDLPTSKRMRAIYERRGHGYGAVLAVAAHIEGRAERFAPVEPAVHCPHATHRGSQCGSPGPEAARDEDVTCLACLHYLLTYVKAYGQPASLADPSVVVREQLTQAQAEVELQRSLARGHELHRANAERREAAQHAWAEDYRQQRDAAQARIAAVEALCDEAEAGMLRDGYRTELPVWGAPTVTAVVRAALNPPPSPPTYTTEEPSSHE